MGFSKVLLDVPNEPCPTFHQTNSEFAPGNRPGPKRTFHLPTIDFQGRTVNFRESNLVPAMLQA